MWFKRLIVVDSEPIEVPKPAVVSAASMATLQSYESICAELGFAPVALVQEQLMAFCTENAIEVYSFPDVQNYMNRVFGRETDSRYAPWGWWPMREKEESIQNWRSLSTRFGGGLIVGVRRYPELIPLPVLETAQKIEKGVPGILGFAVGAQMEGALKDPFLAVVISLNIAPVVVERWDEPGFRRT